MKEQVKKWQFVRNNSFEKLVTSCFEKNGSIEDYIESFVTRCFDFCTQSDLV